MPTDQQQRPFRGFFARRPRTADAVLAAVVLVAAVLVVEGPGDTVTARSPGDVPIIEAVVLAVAAAALYRRRHAPLVVLGIVLAGWCVLLAGDRTLTGLPAVVALYSAGRYAAEGPWGPAGAAAAIALVAADGASESSLWWEDVLFGGLVMFGAWYVGRRLRLRGERAARLARERAAEARRIVTEERARIARELHDVVAHRVSLMTVQAGAAKTVAAADPEGAVRAMGAVEEAGRQALDELRHLLGVLRPDTEPDGLGPQPGLADLPRLVDRMRRAGLEVSLSPGGAPSGLPARVDLFAYRIVQESLTNVLKHAGPGTRADVRLRGGTEGIGIEVRDDGRGTMPGPDAARGGGHGIVGMRERALLLGGALTARPHPDGGFEVVAQLPTGGEPA